MEQPGNILQIDLLKKEAENIPHDAGREHIFWEKFGLEFNYNSNHIEGNTLTYGHTELLLRFDKVVGDYNGREIEEMKAHNVAWKLIQSAALDNNHILSEQFIKEINEVILVRSFYKPAITLDGHETQKKIKPGVYKTLPNLVRLETGEIFDKYSDPLDTPQQMGELIDWYRSETVSRKLHPVHLAAIFHYRLVRIHPFDDGNGRTSRLLMNYILLKFGYAPAVVRSDDKKNYLTALNRADTGELHSFVEYISKVATYWQELYLKAVKGESIEEPNDLDKEIELLKRQLNERKITQRFDKEVGLDFLKHSFVPFFSACYDKLEKFKDLFHSFNAEYIGTSNERVFDLLGKHTNQFFLQEIAIGQSFGIDFDLRGLKNKNDLVSNINLKIRINIQEFTYHITLNQQEKYRGFYDHQLTSEEIETICFIIGKYAIDLVKSEM